MGTPGRVKIDLKRIGHKTLYLQLLYSGKTDQGRIREINEDSILMDAPQDPEQYKKHGALFVMADGLGGMARGEEASGIAVEQMRELFSNFEHSPPSFWIHQSIQAVNTKICGINKNNTREHWMATTLTCSHFCGNKLTVGHVGDSRIYRVRDEELLCLTKDHAFGRHTLTRAVGTDPRLVVDVDEFELKEGDVYVQCSDGLYAYVNEKDIRQTVVGFSPQEGCERLVEMANLNGGGDNISVQIIRIVRGPAK